MIFTDANKRKISKRKFIKFWSDKYDELNKSLYVDAVYFHFINKKNSRNKFLFLGAWKWNMIKECKKKSSTSITIDNKHYDFKKGWSSQGKREFPIFDHMSKIIDDLPKGDNLKDVVDFFYDIKKIKGCGIVNAIFCLHILFPNDYPIYDQFVHYSMDYIFGNTGKENIEKTQPRYLHLYEYNLGYKYFYNKLVGFFSNFDRKRKIDKALWSFGKHISN